MVLADDVAQALGLGAVLLAVRVVFLAVGVVVRDLVADRAAQVLRRGVLANVDPDLLGLAVPVAAPVGVGRERGDKLGRLAIVAAPLAPRLEGVLHEAKHALVGLVAGEQQLGVMLVVRLIDRDVDDDALDLEGFLLEVLELLAPLAGVARLVPAVDGRVLVLDLGRVDDDALVVVGVGVGLGDRADAAAAAAGARLGVRLGVRLGRLGLLALALAVGRLAAGRLVALALALAGVGLGVGLGLGLARVALLPLRRVGQAVDERAHGVADRPLPALGLAGAHRRL
ncbi:MAG: hypothetical protein CL844_03690 [Crocinitomicaceae bacterium]|nr:hypothetical protein [Crocinitomicaceae bacterium]